MCLPEKSSLCYKYNQILSSYFYYFLKMFLPGAFVWIRSSLYACMNRRCEEGRSEPLRALECHAAAWNGQHPVVCGGVVALAWMHTTQLATNDRYDPGLVCMDSSEEMGRGHWCHTRIAPTPEWWLILSEFGCHWRYTRVPMLSMMRGWPGAAYTAAGDVQVSITGWCDLWMHVTGMHSPLTSLVTQS